MRIRLSSRRACPAFSRVWLRLTMIVSAVAIVWCTLAAAQDRVQLARFSEENLPAQDMPSVEATPEANPGADWSEVPSLSPDFEPAVSDTPATAPNAPASSGSPA